MDTKKLEEFTQKVKAGDITDFEPWFDEKDQETLQTLNRFASGTASIKKLILIGHWMTMTRGFNKCLRQMDIA